MTKRCVICNAPAQYQVKDTPEYYCRACAEEHFGDLTLLVTLEEEARELKQYVDQVNDDQDL